MEKMKLTSIRITGNSLESAQALTNQLSFCTQSDVLRLAIWVGLKILTSKCATPLFRKMWEEEAGLDVTTLMDVLHTAGVIDMVKHCAGK